MLETFTIVHTLTDSSIDPRHADTITTAAQQAVEHGDPANQADVAALRADVLADLTAFRAELARRRRLGWEE